MGTGASKNQDNVVTMQPNRKRDTDIERGNQGQYYLRKTEIIIFASWILFLFYLNCTVTQYCILLAISPICSIPNLICNVFKPYYNT